MAVQLSRLLGNSVAGSYAGSLGAALENDQAIIEHVTRDAAGQGHETN